MPGLMIMLPLAVLIALAFLGFFLWSVRNGDYEDIEMQKYRVLMDDGDDVDLTIKPGSGSGTLPEAESLAPPSSGKAGVSS